MRFSSIHNELVSFRRFFGEDPKEGGVEVRDEEGEGEGEGEGGVGVGVDVEEEEVEEEAEGPS